MRTSSSHTEKTQSLKSAQPSPESVSSSPPDKKKSATENLPISRYNQLYEHIQKEEKSAPAKELRRKFLSTNKSPTAVLMYDLVSAELRMSDDRHSISPYDIWLLQKLNQFLHLEISLEMEEAVLKAIYSAASASLGLTPLNKPIKITSSISIPLLGKLLDKEQEYLNRLGKPTSNHPAPNIAPKIRIKALQRLIALNYIVIMITKSGQGLSPPEIRKALISQLGHNVFAGTRLGIFGSTNYIDKILNQLPSLQRGNEIFSLQYNPMHLTDDLRGYTLTMKHTRPSLPSPIFSPSPSLTGISSNYQPSSPLGEPPTPSRGS